MKSNIKLNVTSKLEHQNKQKKNRKKLNNKRKTEIIQIENGDLKQVLNQTLVYLLPSSFQKTKPMKQNKNNKNTWKTKLPLD